MGHSYGYYSFFQAINLMTPFLVFYFAYLYLFISSIIYCCCCISTEGRCFKAFKAITVAAARGLFGATAIRRKDYMNPPCLKIHGKLYEANSVVLIFLLYYIFAVIVIVTLVSLGFSTHVSYGLEACNENVDCFYVNVTDDILDVTDLTNCSLTFEDVSEDVRCFVGLQPAVALALLGGFISFIPPLMFSFTNVVHTNFIFEKCLKYKMPSLGKIIVINFLLVIIVGLAPNLQLGLVLWKNREKEYNNAAIKFILKDTTAGQVSAIIITFVAFLSLPWFMLGKYRKYTDDELKEVEAERQNTLTCTCCSRTNKTEQFNISLINN